MAVTRLCVILTVLVSAKMILAQPIFGTQMWCDSFCDDDDDDDYDSSSGFDDFLDSLFDPCAGCGSSRPTKHRTTTISPAMKHPFNIMIRPWLFDPCAGCGSSRPTKRRTTIVSSAMKQPFNIMIPPASGLNLTLSNTGGSWLMDFIPWMAKPAAAAAATTAAPATTAAATTAAATTAKPGGTTAPPTTKKA